MQRLDKVLVDLGLVDTRSKAQQLIEEGVVYIDNVQAKKAAQRTGSNNIEIRKDHIYVGRGAHKIEGALKDFDIDVSNMIVADVGASTGGFTEYVLEKGAKKVFAIDVGHDQLAEKLCNDSRVINMEGTNIRNLDGLESPCDLAVVDLSFISLKLVMKNIVNLLKEDGRAVVLIKPQFEVGKDNLNKQGVCKNLDVVRNTIEELFLWSLKEKLNIKDFCTCAIKGRTGNQEYFFLYSRGSDSMSILNLKEKLENI